jgi:diguanylate cyclase (GGDEF)-like protein/PAS domain S-box-containing protein
MMQDSARSHAPSEPWTLQATALAWVLTLVLYVFGAFVGRALASAELTISLIWLPPGVAVVALYRGGWRFFPVVAASALLVQGFTFGLEWPWSAVVVLGQVAGPLATVVLLRLGRFSGTLTQRRDVLVFAAAAMLGMLIPASVGVGVLHARGLLVEGLWTNWSTWWMGDVLGVVALAPVGLLWHRSAMRQAFERWRTALPWLGGAVSLHVFLALVPSRALEWPATTMFMPLPFAIWAAMRSTPLVAYQTALAMCVAMQVMTVAGVGPFATPNPSEGAHMLWAHMMSLVLVTALASLLQAERQAWEDRMAETVRALTDTQRSLAGRERVLRQRDQALHSITEAVALVDRSFRFRWANRAMGALLGWQPEALVLQPLSVLYGETTDLERAAALQEAALTRPSHSSQVEVYRADGTPVWVEYSVGPVRQAQGEDEEPMWVVVARDITRQRQREALARREARQDPLTGLSNRRLLEEAYPERMEAWSRHRMLAGLIFVDLDAFKALNDSLGHQAGDARLLEVARRLTRVMGPDHLCCRLGGDEFVVLMGPLTPDVRQAARMLRRKGEEVLASLQEPSAVLPGGVQGGASVGVVLIQEASLSLEDALQRADEAMYQSKRSASGVAGLARSAEVAFWGEEDLTGPELPFTP